MSQPAIANPITVRVNGAAVSVPSGTTVAAAVAMAGQPCRRSVSGEVRGALCGMGSCFECRVIINGRAHRRSCQLLCEPGMDVKTDE